MSSTGNASDFGDLIANGENQYGAASLITGITGGGMEAFTNDCQKVTIASTGNAAYFGALSEQRHSGASASNCHGGLA